MLRLFCGVRPQITTRDCGKRDLLQCRQVTNHAVAAGDKICSAMLIAIIFLIETLLMADFEHKYALIKLGKAVAW